MKAGEDVVRTVGSVLLTELVMGPCIAYHRKTGESLAKRDCFEVSNNALVPMREHERDGAGLLSSAG